MEQLAEKLELLIEDPCFTGSKEPIIFFPGGEFMLMHIACEELLCLYES